MIHFVGPHQEPLPMVPPSTAKSTSDELNDQQWGFSRARGEEEEEEVRVIRETLLGRPVYGDNI